MPGEERALARPDPAVIRVTPEMIEPAGPFADVAWRCYDDLPPGRDYVAVDFGSEGYDARTTWWLGDDGTLYLLDSDITPVP